ncbi:class I SAM-dependent methyltransferase [Candidatus Shapirobacteria bacterium]|nr:class I SAM-dependent methyltransferase [Candidatus Shapirobacteria bacterium]
MKAIPYYDDQRFDYRSYWLTREYESQAEKIALKKLLKLIPQKENLIDIGAGYGRFVPLYAFLFKKCLLVEPSGKLLNDARLMAKSYPHLEFLKSYVEKLPLKDKSFQVAILIRVAHHLKDLETMVMEVHRILKPGGFFILEFANKRHLKNCLEAMLKLNFSFFTSHLPEDLKTKAHSYPFYNYHPNQIKTLLLSNGFTIKKALSVSNFRHPFLKKIMPLKTLLWLEDKRQNLTQNLKFHLGPSIFVLAQKKK